MRRDTSNLFKNLDLKNLKMVYGSENHHLLHIAYLIVSDKEYRYFENPDYYIVLGLAKEWEIDGAKFTSYVEAMDDFQKRREYDVVKESVASTELKAYNEKMTKYGLPTLSSENDDPLRKCVKDIEGNLTKQICSAIVPGFDEDGTREVIFDNRSDPFKMMFIKDINGNLTKQIVKGIEDLEYNLSNDRGPAIFKIGELFSDKEDYQQQKDDKILNLSGSYDELLETSGNSHKGDKVNE